MSGFKVMTWNVENLFRPPLSAGQTDKQRYERKLELLAETINRLEPDVVALQEIGGLEPLQDLQEALAGTYRHRAISAFPDSRGIRVAFLSRLLIERTTDLVDFAQGPAMDVHYVDPLGSTIPLRRFGRGALHIHVSKDGREIDVITAHLKSKLLSYPRPWGTSFAPKDETERAQMAGLALMRRMAEAVTLRMAANDLLEGNTQNPLLVFGDFNDVPAAQTSMILIGPGGSEIGTLGFDRPDKGDDTRLFNLAPLLPPGRDYSRVHNGRRELIDQIFASEELFPIQPDNKRRLPVVDSHVDFEGELASVSDDPSTRDKAIAPDHAPVTATFEW
ncbi:MAG: endonuclease/exonuclease/phosphatase family protein [Caldilineales bacterium]|nr:endonuclease/exonuclease/phosphatase family protein [Caldilineales bacterium]